MSVPIPTVQRSQAMLEKIGKIREYVTHRLYLYREAKRRKAWERAQEERSLALWG